LSGINLESLIEIGALKEDKKLEAAIRVKGGKMNLEINCDLKLSGVHWDLFSYLKLVFPDKSNPQLF
jgi:hypothetical protein